MDIEIIIYYEHQKILLVLRYFMGFGLRPSAYLYRVGSRQHLQVLSLGHEIVEDGDLRFEAELLYLERSEYVGVTSPHQIPAGEHTRQLMVSVSSYRPRAHELLLQFLVQSSCCADGLLSVVAQS